MGIKVSSSLPYGKLCIWFIPENQQTLCLEKLGLISSPWCSFSSHSILRWKENDFLLKLSLQLTTLCDKVCQWLATGLWFSLGTPVSSTNKTDRHNITEILLKVVLNTIYHSTYFPAISWHPGLVVETAWVLISNYCSLGIQQQSLTYWHSYQTTAHLAYHNNHWLTDTHIKLLFTWHTTTITDLLTCQ
jgi:hypothetical protein